MGYYTDYEMIPARHDPGSLSEDTYLAIEAFIEEGIKVDGWPYLSEVWYGRGNTLTWHDHRKDMVRLSAVFPDVLFTLWGDGEETDDLWKEYYLNGKCQIARAVITYPDCGLIPTCPACYGAGILDADGLPSIGCPKCWGTGEIE